MHQCNWLIDCQKLIDVDLALYYFCIIIVLLSLPLYYKGLFKI